MKYFPRIVLLVTGFVVVWLSGCSDPNASEITLTLKVPGSKHYPRNERGAQLMIDGKDYTGNLAIVDEFAQKEVTFNLPIKKDQQSLTIKYGFWKNNYTNFIRTKVVALDQAKTLTVDITEEDPKNRDQIEPIYVPTAKAASLAMLKLAKVTKDDVVWDIGCGDGRLVIMAAEIFGAKKGLGIDINPDRIADSNANLKKSTVGDRVAFKVGNALEIKDVSEASVVLLYMGEDLNLRLRPVLQQTLKPGSRVVSHRYLMGDWTPDESIKIEVINDYDEKEEFRLHLWVIKEPKAK